VTTYPSGFPGLKIGVKRIIKDATTIQQSGARTEFRFSEADELPMEWEMSYTLRQNNGAAVPVDELAQVLAFYEAHRGPTDTFNFLDPYDSVTRLARFDTPTMDIKRVVSGWFEVTANLKSVINPAAAAPTRPLLASLVYPFDIPGRQMEIQRETLWDAKNFQGASLTEANYSHQEDPIYRWTMQFTGRTTTAASEVAAMENWFRYYPGRLRSFAFTDPVDGVSRTVRFDSDLEMTRQLSTWWDYEVSLVSCLDAPAPVTSVIITGPTS